MSFRSASAQPGFVFALASMVLAGPLSAFSQDAPDTQNAAPIIHARPQSQNPAATTSQEPAQPMPEALPPAPIYDKTIFQAILPAAKVEGALSTLQFQRLVQR